MAYTNFTTKREKGQHLTSIERGKIEALLKEKKSKKHIATVIGVSERTIYREIKRGMVKGLLNSDLSERDEYSAEKAQRIYENNQSKKQGYLKIGKNNVLVNFVKEQVLNKRNSLYVALENAKKENIEVNICLKTLYNYFNDDLFADMSVRDLPYKRKKKKKKRIQVKRIRKMGGKSIEERSTRENDRNIFGNWEMDTVVGKREKGACLLVLTERKSRKEIIRKLKSKTKEEVVRAVIGLKKEYKDFNKKFKSITSDNGSEFMDANTIEALGINYYYAHSYCSYERGSNENNNKLIRRFIPKGTSIDNISEKEISKIEKWINSYPRKMFAGKSSNDIYYGR